MRVAVTGASGFIGRHVITELRRRSVDVTAVLRDDVNRAEQPVGESSDRSIFIDIFRPPQDAFARMGSPDALIHLAWGGINDCNATRHVEQELPAQYLFLKGLIESGLRNIVVAGTCYEYGLQSGGLGEDYPTAPITSYGIAKDSLRRRLLSLRERRPFNLAWARLFYMYGPGQPENSLLSQLAAAVQRGERAFKMSEGNQLRDYLPVQEVARNLVELALAGRHWGVVNVCSGEPISVRRLVESHIKENNWDIGLDLGRFPYRDYEPMEFWGIRGKIDSLKP